MFFCSNCGAKLEDNSKFCTVCGTAVAQPAPEPVAQPAPEPVVEAVPVTPAYTAPSEPAYAAPSTPTYTPPSTPTYNTVPTPVCPVCAPVEVSGSVKALGFVGMGLAIGGLFLAALGLLCAMIGMGEEGLGFGYSIGYGMFSWPLSIVGKILCGKSQEAGNTAAPCSVGSKLGLVGIIVSAVMMFFGLINLMI